MTDPFRAKPKPAGDDSPLDVTSGGVNGDGGGALLGVAGPPPATAAATVADEDSSDDAVAGDDNGERHDEKGAAPAALEPLPPRSKLDAMRKADLRALADSRGVTYDGDATKDELVDALERAAGR